MSKRLLMLFSSKESLKEQPHHHYNHGNLIIISLSSHTHCQVGSVLRDLPPEDRLVFDGSDYQILDRLSHVDIYRWDQMMMMSGNFVDDKECLLPLLLLCGG